ncbi:hypothetical protein B0T10DRAFT_571050 [Thelonectria olida]|uniref:Uncharacterized protein n=1 Tax=Thelonectria olida TaxID=1576542 RepID=A0A9P8WMK8_9HYPO|nr:hypothetical protein B0T10DRAFT_571050 [Thelonectria olida]
MSSRSPSPNTPGGRLGMLSENTHPNILTPGAANNDVVYLRTNDEHKYAILKNVSDEGDTHLKTALSVSLSDATEKKDTQALVDLGHNERLAEHVCTKILSSDTGSLDKARRSRPFSWDPIPRPVQDSPSEVETSPINSNLQEDDGIHESQTIASVPNETPPEPKTLGGLVTQASHDRAERVKVFGRMQAMICFAAFSNGFIDKIPSRPSWYNWEYSGRRLWNMLRKEQRLLSKKIDEDMYLFYDSVKDDDLILNRAPPGANASLRWRLVKFIWSIIREEILDYEGKAWAEDLEARTVKHIHGAVRPFLNDETNQKQMSHAVLEATKLATRLRGLLKSNNTTWYELRLPPNLDGTCVGDGTRAHVQYVCLDGKNAYSEGRKIYGTVFDALVRHVRNADYTISIDVECPAMVADYCPQEQEDKSAYY